MTWHNKVIWTEGMFLQPQHFQERGTTYMVMPFYRGNTLRHALAARAGEVDEAWLLDVMDGITQALGVMHAAHCYHRDIAPDNILLLEGSGRPVVLDLGAARRAISDKTQAMTVILKPDYAPIEQYAEMPDMKQGAWTDVYALAAVMHLAVRGLAPPPAVARLLADGYAPVAANETLRQRYGPRLLAAIDASLAVRPQARPQSMGELRAALGLGESTIPATARAKAVPSMALCMPPSEASQPMELPPTSKRNSPAMSLIALGVLVLLAGGGWWLQRQSITSAEAQAVASVQIPSTFSAVDATSAAMPFVPAHASLVVPASVAARTPAQWLQFLAEGKAASGGVNAIPHNAGAAIDKDWLLFELRSTPDAPVYVFKRSSNSELFLMFPNLLDKHDTTTAGAPVASPRASWPTNAHVPAGYRPVRGASKQTSVRLRRNGATERRHVRAVFTSGAGRLEGGAGNGSMPSQSRAMCPDGEPCGDVHGIDISRIVEK